MGQSGSVSGFLAAVMPERRFREAAVLDTLFREVTGWAPALWSGGMLGYGRYAYTYASGRSGEFLATGFAPRKARLSIYILPGYTEFPDLMADLGKHSRGKSCVYINTLADVDLTVLRHLIRAGLDDLVTQWPVSGT